MAKGSKRKSVRSDSRLGQMPEKVSAVPQQVLRGDDSGCVWTLEQVEAEVFAIVAELTRDSNGVTINRKTEFLADLGMDAWAKLRVGKPVRRRLHEELSDYVVKSHVNVVGDLVDYVWSKMENVQ